MTNKVSVPDNGINSLKTLMSLGSSEFDSLVETLEKLPKKMYVDEDLASTINIFFDNEKTSQQVANTILALFVNMFSFSSRDDFINQILSDFCSKGKIRKEERANILEKLKRILSVSSLAISGKSLDIYYEHSNCLTSSRIFTDIRPVFCDSKDSFSDTLITHSLKIEYIKNDESLEIFFALDETDINIMISMLERAKWKAKKIKERLSKAEINIINSSEE